MGYSAGCFAGGDDLQPDCIPWIHFSFRPISDSDYAGDDLFDSHGVGGVGKIHCHQREFGVIGRAVDVEF